MPTEKYGIRIPCPITSCVVDLGNTVYPGSSIPLSLPAELRVVGPFEDVKRYLIDWHENFTEALKSMGVEIR